MVDSKTGLSSVSETRAEIDVIDDPFCIRLFGVQAYSPRRDNTPASYCALAEPSSIARTFIRGPVRIPLRRFLCISRDPSRCHLHIQGAAADQYARGCCKRSSYRCRTFSQVRMRALLSRTWHRLETTATCVQRSVRGVGVQDDLVRCPVSHSWVVRAERHDPCRERFLQGGHTVRPYAGAPHALTDRRVCFPLLKRQLGVGRWLQG